jgi:hypothetical protein
MKKVTRINRSIWQSSRAAYQSRLLTVAIGPILAHLRPRILMIEFQSISWWYWFASACLLTASVFGWPVGFLLVIGLTALQIIHFAVRVGSVRSFPIQVRLGYLLLLITAAPEEARWICWIPMIGTWVQVLFGYCPMARVVSLAPWNRDQPFSMALVKHTFFSAPVRGSFANAVLAEAKA